MGSIGGAGDRDDAALQVPAEKDLISALGVGRCNLLDDVQVVERADAGTATTQREPRLEDGPERGDMRLHVLALAVRMRLVLEDGRFDGRDLHDPVHVVLVEVGDADAVDLPGLHSPLHRLVSVLVVRRRMVEQKQVDIVQAQALQALIDLFVSPVEVGGPEFRCHEDLLPLDAEVLHRPGDAASHADLVAIDIGRVDQPHAYLQGVVHGLLGLRRREEVGPDADDGHLPAAVELHGLCLEVECVCHIFRFVFVGVLLPVFSLGLSLDSGCRRAASRQETHQCQCSK